MALRPACSADTTPAIRSASGVERTSLLLLAAAILGGCASTAQQVPQASEANPPSDKAMVVVERPSAWVGSAVTNKVYDNSTYVGELGSGGRLAWLRAPGPMTIHFEGRENKASSSFFWESGPGRRLTVSAGQKYHYNVAVKVKWSIDGPGVPVTGVTKEQPGADALVFFRLSPEEPWGEIKLVDVKSGQVIPLIVNRPGKPSPWLTLCLPPGEYNIATHEVASQIGTLVKITTYKINADFVITKGNAGVYIGDIVLTKDGITVRKDSDAARTFLGPYSKDLPYTESLMQFNQ